MNFDMEILYKTTVPENSYELEIIRRKSFNNWTSTLNFPINAAAEMGLYYKPNDGCNDLVFCIHCGVSISNWMCNDDIKIKHDANSPYCNEGMNIPIRYKHLTQYILNAKCILYMKNTANSANIITDEDYTVDDWITQYRVCVESMSNANFIIQTLYDIVGFYSEDTLSFEYLDYLDDEDYENILQELENIKKYGKLTQKTEENQL